MQYGTFGGAMDVLADRIEEELPRLRRYARVLLHSEVDADDLVQECVLRALSRTHLWQKDTDLRAWLFTILHNQYVNNVRRSARRGYSLELDDIDEEMHHFPTQDIHLELRDLVRALTLLPNDQRNAVLLVGLEGLDYQAVAKVVGVPVGTVRSRLSRGRDALRRLMGMNSDSNPEAKTVRAAVAPVDNVQNDPQATAAPQTAEVLFAPKRQPVVASAAPAGELVREPCILAAFPPAHRGEARTVALASPERETPHPIPRSTVARVRTWLSYGMTLRQAADTCGVAIPAIKQALRSDAISRRRSAQPARTVAA
jgi:RNA polymerase sigma-70 factor, ECF subfamily